jgi:hypothetical protein
VQILTSMSDASLSQDESDLFRHTSREGFTINQTAVRLPATPAGASNFQVNPADQPSGERFQSNDPVLLLTYYCIGFIASTPTRP